MLDEEFSKLLVQAPNPGEAVEELFLAARNSCEQQFFLSLLDFSRTRFEDKSFLFNDPQPRWVLQQFLKYFRAVVDLRPDSLGKGYEDLVMRLQMLAYGQFWEAFAVKRIFSSLLATCVGEKYSVRNFMKYEEEITYEFYKDLRKKARNQQLKIADTLDVLYKNQIRNAFAHSQFCVLAGYIIFANFEKDKPWSIPSSKLETWDRLFELTKGFIIALFKAWDEGLGELKGRIPYQVMIAGNSYLLGIDKRDGSFRLIGR